MKPLPQDTPIHRATLRELTHEQLVVLIQEMQERRMRAQTAYEDAQAAKKAIKDEKDKLLYEKRLEQIFKSMESADKALEKVSKYLVEVQALRLTIGDLA